MEEHLQTLNADDMDEDDDAAWNGWDLESESDSSSSEGGWNDVDSEGDLEISDSDNELIEKPTETNLNVAMVAASIAERISLATTKVRCSEL